jgi:urease accessory protein
MDASRGDLALVRLLQLADSGFPSGAYTLSHGLETLLSQHAIGNADDVASFVRVNLLAKLARSDLIALLAVHDAATDPAEAMADDDPVERIVAIDRRLTASKIAADDRIGSARVGRRLATEVARLVPSAALLGFLGAIEERRTAGNAAVAFGLAGSAFGIERRPTALAAASASVIGLSAAAVRLGLIGHGSAQRLIADSASDIAAAVNSATLGHWNDLRPSAPQVEIALATHETAPARQFAS